MQMGVKGLLELFSVSDGIYFSAVWRHSGKLYSRDLPGTSKLMKNELQNRPSDL